MIYEFSFKPIYIKLHQGRIWFIIMIVFFRSLECCQIGHGIPNIKPRLFLLIRPYSTKVEFQQYNFEREQDIHSYLVWQFLFKGNFKACLKHWRLQKRKSVSEKSSRPSSYTRTQQGKYVYLIAYIYIPSYFLISFWKIIVIFQSFTTECKFCTQSDVSGIILHAACVLII